MGSGHFCTILRVCVSQIAQFAQQKIPKCQLQKKKWFEDFVPQQVIAICIAYHTTARTTVYKSYQVYFISKTKTVRTQPTDHDGHQNCTKAANFEFRKKKLKQKEKKREENC